MESATDINSLPLDQAFHALASAGLVRRLFELAADEDLGILSRRAPGALPSTRREARYAGDLTTEACIDPNARAEAGLVARSAGVISGLACVPMLVEVFTTDVRWSPRSRDGDVAQRNQALGTFEGPLDELLALERTLLNTVGRLSGIATHARAYVEKVAGTPARIFDTRKTTPGLRALEKYAVRCGGAHCHRIGLFDAVLIKDNHLAGVNLDELPLFVAGAMERARMLTGKDVFFQVEVDTLAQFESLLVNVSKGLDSVLLDNMTPQQLCEAVALRARHKRGEVALEASGGVNLESVGAISRTGIDRISVGAITHSSVQLDVALDITRIKRSKA